MSELLHVPTAAQRAKLSLRAFRGAIYAGKGPPIAGYSGKYNQWRMYRPEDIDEWCKTYKRVIVR